MDRFFADAMLGRLARRMRLAGFDTLYERAIDDAELVRQAKEQRRTIVTRDRRLLLRRDARAGILVTANQVDAQWRELISIIPQLLSGPALSRCAECNALIATLGVEEAKPLVPPYVAATQTRFYRCPNCRRIYWPGTHIPRIIGMLNPP